MAVFITTLRCCRTPCLADGWKDRLTARGERSRAQDPMPQGSRGACQLLASRAATKMRRNPPRFQAHTGLWPVQSACGTRFRSPNGCKLPTLSAACQMRSHANTVVRHPRTHRHFQGSDNDHRQEGSLALWWRFASKSIVT